MNSYNQVVLFYKLICLFCRNFNFSMVRIFLLYKNTYYENGHGKSDKPN